jgi:hypothetical protein
MLGTIVIATLTVFRIVLPILILLGIGELVRRRMEKTPQMRGSR